MTHLDIAFFFFFFNDTATTEIYTLSLHDALPISLYDYGAEIAIAGHDHEYERFAPQTPDGHLDTVRGIRAFVVGTGGGGLYSFGTPLPNSQVRNSSTWGVLKLTLADGSYSWEFVPITGQTFTDSGSGTCH